MDFKLVKWGDFKYCCFRRNWASSHFCLSWGLLALVSDSLYMKNSYTLSCSVRRVLNGDSTSDLEEMKEGRMEERGQMFDLLDSFPLNLNQVKRNLIVQIPNNLDYSNAEFLLIHHQKECDYFCFSISLFIMVKKKEQVRVSISVYFIWKQLRSY